MGAYDKSPSLIIEDRHRPHRHGNAQAFDRICGEFQPASSSPRSLVSESIQVHFMPGGSVPIGTVELVRYIHLNPLRAGIVEELKGLNTFPYCGHYALMGKTGPGFQEVDYILNLFGEKVLEARRLYLEFVKKGVAAERRPDLTGGGLVRSAGGWSALKAMRNGESRMKGDERILGQGNSVETVLKAAQENLDRKSQILVLGYDFDWLVGRVLGLFGLTFNELLTGGKQRKIVQARSVLCYWGTRELAMSAVSISEKLNIASSTASESAMRGRQIVEDQGWKLLEEWQSENPRNVP